MIQPINTHLNGDLPTGLQAALLQCIGHPERALRRTVGSSVAAVVAAAGLAAWPELVPALAAGLGAPDLATLEGSLDCLHKVWTCDGAHGPALVAGVHLKAEAVSCRS